MRNPIYANRRPKESGEPVELRREGESQRWHARTASGELIAIHQYRNDLLSGLRKDGFDPTLIGD